MSNLANQNQFEHKRLLRLAREYRQNGYKVTLYPSPDSLPPALKNCSIDLVASSAEKTIAVEVRTKESLTLNGSEDLRTITHQVDQIPGWELELVVTNPRRNAG